jgi:hypothetical protein
LPPRGDETQFRRSTQMRPATGADAKVYKT